MNLITDNLPTILGYIFGSGFLGAYIFERRKNNAVTKGVEADVDSKDIQNGKDVVSMYKEALIDSNKIYEKKFNDIVQMYDRKTKVLEDEIKLHKRMNTALKRENADLKRQLKDAESNSSK